MPKNEKSDLFAIHPKKKIKKIENYYKFIRRRIVRTIKNFTKYAKKNAYTPWYDLCIFVRV